MTKKLYFHSLTMTYYCNVILTAGLMTVLYEEMESEALYS